MSRRAPAGREVVPGGKVFFVGAGPGDPGLITVRGQQLIESADAIVYDSLVSPAVIPPSARVTHRPELYFVGKMKGAKKAPSREVISLLLVKLAREGKRVVRLTGGDPFIFGSASEEAQSCNDSQIEFEVVPGVTAAAGAAAYAGIPLAARGIAAVVTMVNGAEVASKRLGPTDWGAIAKSGGTLVLYSSVRIFPTIAKSLSAAGMGDDVPAAAIEWGTRPRQRTVTATLATLAKKMAAEKLTSPAIILVGWPIVLREELAWFEKRPLFGKRIVVTRAPHQAAALSDKLRELGAEVIEMPATDIARLDPAPLRRLFPDLAKFRWLILSSRNGVEIFWENLLAAGLDARALAQLKVAAVGPATAAALFERGIAVDVIPERFVAEGLLEQLGGRDDIAGARVLYVTAEGARETLAEGLGKLGANVTTLPIYSSVPNARGSRRLAKRIAAGTVDVITFTAASAVHAFVDAVGPELAVKIPAASIGPQTSRALRDAGIPVTIEAEESTIDGLVAALLNGF